MIISTSLCSNLCSHSCKLRHSHVDRVKYLHCQCYNFEIYWWILFTFLHVPHVKDAFLQARWKIPINFNRDCEEKKSFRKHQKCLIEFSILFSSIFSLPILSLLPSSSSTTTIIHFLFRNQNIQTFGVCLWTFCLENFSLKNWIHEQHVSSTAFAMAPIQFKFIHNRNKLSQIKSNKINKPKPMQKPKQQVHVDWNNNK